MHTVRMAMAALAVGGVLVSGGRAHAQAPVRWALREERVAADSAPEMGRLERARNYLALGAIGAARRELAREVRGARAGSAFSGEAFWLLANLEHEARPLRAAELLDRLAESAGEHGDPVTQAQALLEAAVIYQKEDQPELSRERVARLLPLLGSPYLPEVTRAALRARIAER